MQYLQDPIGARITSLPERMPVWSMR